MLPRVNVISTDIGQYLLLATQDIISTHLLLKGSWEPWQLSISQLLLDGIERPHVVDVGANLGSYTVPVGRLIAERGGTLSAFEAQRLIFLQLCGNIFLNRLDNVYPQHLALGDQDDEIELPALDYAREINIGALSVDPEIRRQQAQTSTGNHAPQTESVLRRRLDSLALAPISLLKIDTEGCELEVLRGAARSLADSGWPPILFELWSETQQPWYREKRAATLACLDGLGYRSAVFGETGLAQHPAHPRQFSLVQENSGAIRLTRQR
ncbi:MAG TPA: FkbM family methyltransferase [Rhodocyclaceae bacterium]|nr:FkbM family methyltransferase [Rhodocyclaceae bacterium]